MNTIVKINCTLTEPSVPSVPLGVVTLTGVWPGPLPAKDMTIRFPDINGHPWIGTISNVICTVDHGLCTVDHGLGALHCTYSIHCTLWLDKGSST